MKVGIVGLGLIGGSMGLDLKERKFATEILGYDASEESVKEALNLNLIDRAVTFADICKEADLIILATPVSVISSLLPKILDCIGAHQSVTDVGSAKAEIAKKIKGHAKRRNFVLSHPMAGTEFSGPKAALHNLFNNKATILCDVEESDSEHVEIITKMYNALQMRIIHMNSDEHDLHAAYVSHLSHISSFLLANTVLDKSKDVNAIFNLASAGFESTVRLAKSSPDMWAPIFAQNQQYISEALSAYISRLVTFHESIIKKDFEQTKKYMQRSNEIKGVLEQITERQKGKK